MTKDNQTTIAYDDDIEAWISDYPDIRDCSKGAAIRYCIRQQMEREKVEE